MDAIRDMPQPTEQKEILASLPPHMRRKLNETAFALQSLETILNFVLDTALALVGAQYGSVRWVQYWTKTLVLKAIRTAPGTSGATSRACAFDLHGGSVMAHVARAGKPRLIDDLSTVPEYVSLGADRTMCSELAVPLFSNDGQTVVGVLNVESPHEKAFTLQHQEWLLYLGQHVQMWIQQAHFSETVQTLAYQLVTSELDALLTYTVAALADLLHAPACSLWLLDEGTGELVLRQAVGRPSLISNTQPQRLSRATFLGRTLDSTEPQYLRDVRTMPDFHNRQLAIEQNWVSILMVPIRSASGEALGVISVYSAGKERDFTQQDRKLSMAFAYQVATALQRAALTTDKERYAKYLRVISAILTASMATDDLDMLLHQAVLLISQTFGYRVDLCLIEHHQLVFKVTSLYDATVQNEGQIFPLGQGITGTVAASGRSLIVPNVSNDPRYYCSSPETQSELAVVLLNTQGQPVGVLNVESKEANAFTREDQQMLEVIAADITLTFENARRRKERTALRQVATAVTHSQNIQHILDDIAQTVLALFTAEAFTLYFASADGQLLTLVKQHGFSEALVQRVRFLRRGQGIVGTTLALGTSQVVVDVVSDKRTSGLVTADDHLKSMLAVPIKTDRELLGVIGVLTANTRLFIAQDVELLEEIGSYIGLAIEKRRVYEQAHRLSQVYQGHPDPIFTIDLQGYILDANTAAVQISGYSAEELRGLHLGQLVADEAIRAEVHERVSRVGSGETVPIMEFAMQGKEPSIRFFESNLTPVYDHVNSIIALQAIWRDITARRHAAARMHQRNKQLTALWARTKHSLHPFDYSDLITQVTQAARELLESDRCVVHLVQEGLLVETSELCSDDQDSSLERHRLRLHEGLIGQVAQQAIGRRVNAPHEIEALQPIPSSLGTPPQRLLVMPMQAPEGVMGVISVARNGRQRQPCYTPEDAEYLELLANLLTLELGYRRIAEAQEKQRTALTVLEQMGRVGSFFAHKVCGFLGAMGVTAKLLHKHLQPTNQATAALMENLRLHGPTADRLVTQFRNMQKPVQQDTTVISLSEAVEMALQHVSLPLCIQVDRAALEDMTVRANYEVLLEILEGVLQNALDAMPAGGQLSIRGYVHDGQAEASLLVSDTGCGMSSQVRENLFNPFFSTKIDSGGGLGLGLWLSRLYLQSLGGDIRVMATSPEGSTLELRLPVVSAERLTCAETFPVVQTSALGPPRAEMVTSLSNVPYVLLVEDESYWQGVLAPLLTLRGLQVQTATSAAEARQQLGQQSFAAFVVDVRLVAYDQDNMDGLELVRQICARAPGVPVLMLSVWEPTLAAAKEQFNGWDNVQIFDKMDLDGLEVALDRLAERLLLPAAG